MTSKEKENLYNEAIAFYELAECGRNYIPEQKHVESYIPYIVNMTFCTELLLKLILLENGKSIEDVEKIGHNLKSLYDELSSTNRDVIYSLFKRPLVYNIDEELDNIKKSFVDWRYLVLNKSKGDTKKLRIKPFFLKELNEVLLDICENII